MRSILALAILALVPSITFCADEFTIEDYAVEWNIAKHGWHQLLITKNQKATNIVIRKSIIGGNNLVEFTPEVAVKVGDALLKTSEMARALKGTVSQRERVDVGEFTVNFVTTKKGKFEVYFNSKVKLSLSSINDAIDEETANAFASHLRKAAKMAEFLDSKVEF